MIKIFTENWGRESRRQDGLPLQTAVMTLRGKGLDVEVDKATHRTEAFDADAGQECSAAITLLRAYQETAQQRQNIGENNP